MTRLPNTEVPFRPFPQAGALATVEACLDRIRELNPQLNALLSVDEVGARRRAEECDAAAQHGNHFGVLHGMPIVLKDNIDVEGFVTSNGSPATARTPTADSVAAARLRASGAILLAKANLDEFALGATGTNAHFGRCANPWDPERVPGGSSGGSAAAVSAAMCLGAIGTDTSGSVRTPSALNGLVGLRPSRGAIPVTGTTPVSPFLDTVGPMARSAVDVMRLFLAMAGDGERTDRRGPARGVDVSSATADLTGLSIGVPADFFFDQCDSEVTNRVQVAIDVLRSRGARVTQVRLPDARPAHAHLSRMMLAEAYEYHRPRLQSEPDSYGPDVRRRILSGSEIDGVDYAESRKWAAQWASDVRAVFGTYDVLVSPTVPMPAPRLADFGSPLEATARLTGLTYGWTLAAGPIMTVPCGLVSGLPVGMQLIADLNREDLLFRTAIAYQEYTSWHRMWPQLVAATQPAQSMS
jgi:aspartyl-tRNA(Asn)/glutamyl-tRNA(Gln) amidotransferase subunit A